MGSCLSSSDGRQRNSDSPSSSNGAPKHKKGSKKKQGSCYSSSFNPKRDEQLQAIPGRIFRNGSSGVASLFTQQGRKGTNQDAMVVWENFGSRTDTVFCGVFDGHGPFGHLVARRVRDSLPLKLYAHWDANASFDELRQNSISTAGSMNSEETASICLDEESRGSVDSGKREKVPEMFMTLKETFLRAFKVMDKELSVHPKIDSFCSGTTAVTLIKQGQYLIIGNVGDSRAVLGTRNEDNSLAAVQLTVDLKPNLPKEEERIRQCKGRVFALQDEPEVARVWLPNNNSPGLAMARAFGDFCLKDFGLISVPEVSYRHLIDRDEFVVLATDGVWDVLSNLEVVEVIASAPSRSSAARFLVESAVRAWRYKYPTSKVDDCAVVCLFLNADPSDSAASYSDTKELSESSEATENVNEKEVSSVPVSLERSGTVRAACDDTKGSPRQVSKSHSGKWSSNGNAPTMVGRDWSALEGVSRVNTLLTLPRFVSIGESKLPMNTN